MALRLERKYHHRRGSAETWEFAIGIPTFHFEAEDDPRLLRIGAGIAIAFHITLMLVTIPALEKEPIETLQARRVFVLRQVRFQAPKPRVAAPALPKPQARKIPIPDPTPDLPEPLIDDYRAPEVQADFADTSFVDLSEIPDAPPAPSGTGTARNLEAGILAPQRISGEQPRYTEEARLTRVQGFVILRGVIDEEGFVKNLTVVKSLPKGLTESAMETVGAWRYHPATQDGVPVAVFYVFNINFSLQ